MVSFERPFKRANLRAKKRLNDTAHTPPVASTPVIPSALFTFTCCLEQALPSLTTVPVALDIHSSSASVTNPPDSLPCMEDQTAITGDPPVKPKHSGKVGYAAMGTKSCFSTDTATGTEPDDAGMDGNSWKPLSVSNPFR